MDNIQFNAVEVLKMAQRIEKKGMKYYEAQAERFSSDQNLQDLFLRLKSEEKDHYSRFKNLTKDVKRGNNREEYEYLQEPEVMGYLRSLVEFSIFPENVEEENEKSSTINDVLLIAIMAEKESILFYKEILNYNSGETAEILEKLIEEERNHLIDLNEISKKYD